MDFGRSIEKQNALNDVIFVIRFFFDRIYDSSHLILIRSMRIDKAVLTTRYPMCARICTFVLLFTKEFLYFTFVSRQRTTAAATATVASTSIEQRQCSPWSRI